MHLDDLALFTRIVALGSLSAAARERQVPVSQITRALARLEAGCGVRLLHRSTHALSLTDEGDTVLAHALRMLETAAELESDLTGKLAGPSGWVRVSVSTIIGQALIAPSLPALLARHPQLRLDISADDRLVDMAREGVDIAIRTGTPTQELLVARPIGQLSRRLYAAPAYVTAHGLPERPEDLARHRLVGSSSHPALNRWQLARRGPEGAPLVAPPVLYRAEGHTRSDSTAMVLSLVLAGVGIGRVIDLAAAPAVARGQLVPVLPDWWAEPPVPMHAVMLQNRQRLPKIRACVDHWAEVFGASAAQPLR